MAPETFDFRSWIREQPQRGYKAIFTDNDHFVLDTDYASAQINFYDMTPDPEIVEFHIQNKADGEAKFFLHFHPVEREHATQLFREMCQALVALREQQTTEVLLCCTVGMTTSFFAEKLNQVAEALELDWHFSAVAASEAIASGHDKAAVLVAPQIGYEASRLQTMLPNVPVLAIPTTVFASYDAAGCMEWVREELRTRKQTVEDRALEHVARGLVNDKRVFVIATHAAANKVTIHYRLYDHGKVERDQKVIKRTLSLADLIDVIDTQVCSCNGTVNADAVGIALPGIFHNGMYSLELSAALTIDQYDLTGDLVNNDRMDLAAYFQDRYRLPVFFCNNANAAALGWYGSQDEFENVAFYSMAPGWAIGGQGHVANGQLVEGAHGIAGEIRFIVNQLRFSRPLHYNPYTPEDVLELVGQVIAMDCATFDPEVIALRCDLLPDTDEVAREVMRYIREPYLPKIVRVTNYNECILLGMMVYSLQQLAKQGA